MKYIALLRGINVGGNKKVDMKKLKTTFESMGFKNVYTYINSGNIIFDSSEKTNLDKKIEKKIKSIFGFDVDVIVKTQNQIKKIVNTIPKTWINNPEQRTDVAFLFSDVDNKNILDQLPINKEWLSVRYTKGALYWNMERKNLNKSRLNKLISHKLYKFMTIRNINTSRYLANYK